VRAEVGLIAVVLLAGSGAAVVAAIVVAAVATATESHYATASTDARAWPHKNLE